MKKIALIVEYNPFHNGHLKQIEEAKKRYPESILIAICSGNYTQRGELSYISKEEKTLLALNHGIDVVIELPLPYCIESSNNFAKKAIEIIKELNANVIIFGTENLNTEELIKRAKQDIILESSDKFKQLLKSGNSVKTSFNLLRKDILMPNDLLGLNYIKEILRQNIELEIITYRRENNYLQSASKIRNTNNIDELKELIPIDCLNIVKNKKNIDIFPFLKLKILSEGTNIKKYIFVNEGIEHKILKIINKCTSYEDFINSLISKRYSINHIKRMSLSILLGIQNKYIKEYRILGFNKKGQKFIKTLNTNFITNISKDNYDYLKYDMIYYHLSYLNSSNISYKPIIKKA